MPARHARLAMPRAFTTGCRRHARPATRPITTRRRIRTTGRPASRPPAGDATRRPDGRARPSITRRPRSRYPGRTCRAACSSCHASGVYNGLPAQCVSCHQAAYDGTTDPNHRTAGFPTTCEICHTPAGWAGATFNHSQTAFPLTGAHGQAACSSCHASGVYNGLPTACATCHQADYDATTNPNHRAAGFPTTCEHLPHDGRMGRRDLQSLADLVPADGCARCRRPVRPATPRACTTGCPRSASPATRLPTTARRIRITGAAGFPTTCETCHTTAGWAGATFNHSQTAFPLTGAHAQAACSSCHASGVYNGLPTACASCHQADYDATTDPNHRAAGFPTTCGTCHSTTRWDGATFNHSQTSFPLTGAHLQVACSSCHASGVYDGLPTACASCHQHDYDATTDPNHGTAGFPTTCETCHTTTTWTGATFNHSLTSFPLTGAHLQAACSACHASGVYNGLPTAVRVLPPARLRCARRIQTTGRPASRRPARHATRRRRGTGATFNHSQTSFPLTGTHTASGLLVLPRLGCVQWAADGSARPAIRPPTTRTTDPNHRAAGFPTTCEICHTTTRWDGATFNHSLSSFPLTGAHVAGGLLVLPRLGCLQRAVDGQCVVLPPGRLRRHDGSKPPGGRLPDDLRDLPYDDDVGSARRSITPRLPSR